MLLQKFLDEELKAYTELYQLALHMDHVERTDWLNYLRLLKSTNIRRFEDEADEVAVRTMALVLHQVRKECVA